MNAERLLQHYERIADAPDAIARLRRFILDLAVRGKLVPQDAKDEPALELLSKIATEKASLEKTGALKKQKDIPDSKDPPFNLPHNWRWSQLAEIGILSPRNDAADALDASFVPMPLIAAEYGVANQHEVRSWGEMKKGYTHFAEGDVGLAKITPCFENGKSTVFQNLTGRIGAGTTELHIVRPLFVDPNYVLLFLKSPHFIETGIPKMTGTAGQKRVPTEYFAYSPFPLPPLAEQRRIVAKVDELMGLCDQLEAARNTREAARNRFAAASLARLNAPNPETFTADARFALNALPALTTRPDQIKQLRQTILNLAVRGALTESSVKTFAAPCSDAVLEAPKPYPIGIGWRWVQMDEIVKFTGGSQPPKSTFIYEAREGYTRLVQIRDFKSDAHLTFVPTDKATRPFREEDVMIARYGPPVFQILRGLSGTYNVALMKAEPIVSNLANDFLFYLLQESRIHDAVVRESERTAGQTGVRLPLLNSFVVGLPPLTEQHRIVAKIRELMALCDGLEASLNASTNTRRQLLDALLAEALAPTPALKLEAAE
jgi:type I restriction enzyme S subunit